jgi:Resolvase, N terminal domain
MSTQVAANSRLKRTQAGKAAPSSPSPARRDGHLIGYARVSSIGQDTATQEAKLKVAGCTLIRTETVSGGSRNGRNELASILDFIRSGDVLIVVKLDRLGRNTRGTSSISSTNWKKKEQASECWSLPSTPAGRWAGWS